MKNILITTVALFLAGTPALFSQTDVKPKEEIAFIKKAGLGAKAATKPLPSRRIYNQRASLYKPYADVEAKEAVRPVVKTSVVNIKTYPNPVVNELSVEVSDASPANSYEMSLFDMQGRKLQSSAINAKSHKLNLADVTPGMYLLQVQKNGAIVKQEKIVKQ